EQPRDGFGVVAVALLQAHLHVVILVHLLVVEARDAFVSADHDPERRGYVGRIDAEIGGARAVDVDAQFRLIDLQRHVGVEEYELRRALAQLIGVLEQGRQVGAAQHEFDVGEAPPAEVDGLWVADRRAEVREFAQPLAHLLLNVPRGIIAAEDRQRLAAPQPLPEFRQVDRALLVRRDADVNIGAVDRPYKRGAGAAQHHPNLGYLFQLGLDRLQSLVHRDQAGPFGGRKAYAELRLVNVAGNEILLAQTGRRNGRGHHQKAPSPYQEAMSHDEMEHPRIGAVNITVKTAARPRQAAVLMSVVDMNQPRAHRRRQRERNQQRDHDRHRRRDPELFEEASRDRGHKRDRQEDDDQRERRREHRQADLFGGLPGGLHRVHLLLFYEPEDVFQHDDGVVDDHAHHQ